MCDTDTDRGSIHRKSRARGAKATRFVPRRIPTERLAEHRFVTPSHIAFSADSV